MVQRVSSKLVKHDAEILYTIIQSLVARVTALENKNNQLRVSQQDPLVAPGTSTTQKT